MLLVQPSKHCADVDIVNLAFGTAGVQWGPDFLRPDS